MTNQSENIVESMAAIRRRGVVAAAELNHEMTRLTDWREHFRANPMPFLLSAVSIGYFLIPTRAKAAEPNSVVDAQATKTATPLNTASSFSDRALNSIRAQVTAMAARWISTTVSNFVAQQMQSFKEHQDGHNAGSQRSDNQVERTVRK